MTRSRENGVIDPYPWYAFRPWHGMRFGTWARVLVDHRFRVAPSRIPFVLPSITFAAAVNSIAAQVQRLLFGRALARTVVEPPVFVVGHWRTGTTLVHELLALDGRFAYPTTRHAFAPSTSIVLRPLISQLAIFVPRRRPMDDMRVDLDSPQEDEFALCNLGVPSPYLTMLFPDDRPAAPEYFDLERVSKAARRGWQAAFYGFLQTVTFGDGRPIVLKSPTHTARIGTLHDLFPAARFVHTVRDPRSVFPSTMRLWQTLYLAFGLQKPTFRGLTEHVLSTFERMYAAFDRQRVVLAPHQLVEVRYEDLIADPVAQMQRVYEELQLGEFERVRPKIERYFWEHRDHRARTYPPDADLESILARRWGPHLERFGYFGSVPVSGASRSAATRGGGHR